MYICSEKREILIDKVNKSNDKCKEGKRERDLIYHKGNENSIEIPLLLLGIQSMI